MICLEYPYFYCSIIRISCPLMIFYLWKKSLALKENKQNEWSRRLITKAKQTVLKFLTLLHASILVELDTHTSTTTTTKNKKMYIFWHHKKVLECNHQSTQYYNLFRKWETQKRYCMEIILPCLSINYFLYLYIANNTKYNRQITVFLKANLFVMSIHIK